MNNAQSLPNYMLVMQDKHKSLMAAHISEHGPLGELRNPPTQEQLDQDFERRKTEGTLFTQQRESEN